MSRAADLIALARPRHWVKGVFVLMPVPFGLASGGTLDPIGFLLGLAGFSLATSAVYAFNDAADAAQDRLHPTKRHRPVAAGRIGANGARAWALALMLGGLGLAAASGHSRALGIVLVYVALNVLYCLGAKNVPLVDVFLLSAGFVLRVLLGCALIEVDPSNWLLLCSSGLALFLALAKRRGDLVLGVGTEHRPSLAGYSVAFLDQAIGVMAAITLIAYALYTMDAEVLLPRREFATLPFVVFGVLDYLRLVQLRNHGGSPVEVVLSSRALLVCGAGWLVAAYWSVRV